MKLVFATNNEHKLSELKSMLGDEFQLISLSDIGCFDDIPETAPTLEGNASQKSKYITDHFRLNCFADDTGLEIEALNNQPGVYSARYAGEEKNAQANMQKVLKEMEKIKNRNARFRTVISLRINENEWLFEGVVEGEILENPRGEKGFGYDPIFKPLGYDESFAQMNMKLKNSISHRGRAVEKLVRFLKEL